MTIPSTGYWMFICNPEKWAIDKFLATNQHNDRYQVTETRKHQFAPGQLGVIRVGTDRRSRKVLDGHNKLERGIYGIVQVLSESYPRPLNASDSYWSDPNHYQNQRSVVDIRYLSNLLNSPVLLTELKAHDFIDPSVIEGRQESSFPLQRETFELILKLSHSESAVENIEPIEANSVADLAKLEVRYKDATPEVKYVVSKRIERGPIGDKVKQLANYECMVCKSLGKNSYAFTKKNGEQYIEAHHVIPVSTESRGVLHSANVITVCANHHRQMHYGNVEILENTERHFVFSIDGATIKVQKFALNRL